MRAFSRYASEETDLRHKAAPYRDNEDKKIGEIGVQCAGQADSGEAHDVTDAPIGEGPRAR